jgi:lipid A disaccharide synthetase
MANKARVELEQALSVDAVLRAWHVLPGYRRSSIATEAPGLKAALEQLQRAWPDQGKEWEAIK